MGFRKPLQTIGTFTAAANEIGGGSLVGGFAHRFTVPQDADNLVVKFTASVVAATYSAVLQTTDDGGTTWYDVARTSLITNANATTAEWLSGPTISIGMGSSPLDGSQGSVAGFAIGSAAASTLSAKRVSGLPMLSPLGRVFVRITGNITDAASNTYTAQVKVNSESNNA